MTHGEWHALAEDRDDSVGVTAAAALHGLLDAPGPPPGAGDPLPPLWHWLAFLPDAAQRDLAEDGHPRPGAFMPPTDLPRRMFAGAHITLLTDVPVGSPLHRHSMVTSIADKSGRTGRLKFVDVTNRLTSNGREVIVEIQNIVYRESSDPTASPTGFDPGLEPIEEDAWELRHDLSTDPTVLFRFSALTYNAHRIHYDRDYATGVEGYPGLVVHGPLQAIALSELCRRHAPDRRRTSFSFRALRPAFDGAPLRLRGRFLDATRAELVALDRHGQRTMTAETVFDRGH
jgi:3-methylfumaryl-CoA hydratase